MKQFVLTRSAYGPAWDLRANSRRLAITRAVTARLMAAQTATDWTWVVLLDERDPNLRARMALFEASAPRFMPIVWMPPAYPPRERLLRQRIAAADYRAPWRRDIPADDTVLMSRLDDDDGLAPDALARFRAQADVTKRTALMLPMGVWVYRRAWVEVRHERNAMHALVTPPGDGGCIYDYSHVKVATAVGEPVMVDDAWGWVWVRHVDTISSRGVPRNFTRDRPARINAAVRAAFPLDWNALERAL